MAELDEGVTLPMSTTSLDTDQLYMVMGPDEKIWLFCYETRFESDREKCTSWQAYTEKPGEMVVPQGPRTERQVLSFLNKHEHQLDDDDKFNLMFWVYRGGLESFLKENRKGDKNAKPRR